MNRFQFRGLALGALALSAALANSSPIPQAGTASVMGSSTHGALVKAKGPDRASLMSKARSNLFLENHGQWNSKALYHAHSKGLDYWVTHSGIVLDFNHIVGNGKRHVRSGHSIEMSFVGAGRPVASADQPAKVRTDFLLGGHSSAIHAKSYSEVRLNELYPGVDMRNYFDGGRPRYDLVVKPGADASKIQMAFNGQTKLSLNKDGSLVMGTSLGDQRQAGLKAYTILDGKQTIVRSAFKVLPGNKVAFELGQYDHKAKLVIDPLIYGSYFGGDGGRDSVIAVTSTPDGGVYMTGWTESAAFPVITGAYQYNLVGARSAFITLFRGDAYDVLYNSYISSGGSDEGHFLHVTPDGSSVWIAGTTTSTSGFPLVNPGSSLISSVPNDANNQPVVTTSGFLVQFLIDPVAYLNPSYATYLCPDSGTNGTTKFSLNGFAISPSDQNLLVAGTISGDATIASSVNSIQPMGGLDVYLIRLDLTGSSFVAGELFGGSQDDSVTGLATDSAGDFVISGTVVNPSASQGGVNQLDLSVHTDYFNTTAVGWPNGRLLRGSDLYAAKIRPDMSTAWSGVVGGSLDDVSGGYNDPTNGQDPYTNAGPQSLYYDYTPTISTSVATDNSDNVYIIGTSSSFNYPRTANTIGEANREGTAVVTQIAADGSSFIYSTGLNTGGAVYPVGIGVDGSGNASITGLVWSFPGFNGTTEPNPDAFNTDGGTGSVQVTTDALKGKYTWINNNDSSTLTTMDAWLNVIDPAAANLLYGTYIGGDGNETIAAPFVDQFGDIWTFGLTDQYYGYQVPPWGTNTTPKNVSYDTFLPAGFITPLAFKANVDAQTPIPAPQAPYPGVGTSWQAYYVYTNWHTPSLPVYEDADGYILRFRIVAPSIGSFTLNPTVAPGGLGTTVTGTVTLSAPAPAGGADVSLAITTNLNAAQFVGSAAPANLSLTIPAGATTGTFRLSTNPVLAATPVTIEANYQGNIKFAQVTVVPWLQQFVVTPSLLTGGYNVQAKVTLSAAAPTTGVAVAVDADNEAAIATSLPTTIRVPSGSTTITVPITTALVTQQTVVNLSASLLGVTDTAAITLNPLTIGIQSLTLAKTTLNAGQNTVGTITLATPAPDAGLDITVTSGSPSVAFFTGATAYPATQVVHVGANALTATFTVFAGTIADTATTSITASTTGGSTATTNLTVNQVTYTFAISPASVAGGAGSSGTLTLAAPATLDTMSFTFTSSDSATVPTPATQTITSGLSTITFGISTNPTSATEDVTITPTLGVTAPESVPGSLNVRTIGISNFYFAKSSVRALQSDTGYVVLDGVVPNLPAYVNAGGLSVTITYGTGSTPGSTYFSIYTISTLIPVGKSDNKSGPINIKAKRFTRPVTAPIQASVNGSSMSTSVAITR